MPLADRIRRHHEISCDWQLRMAQQKSALSDQLPVKPTQNPSDVDFLVEFEDGRSLFDVIRLKDDLETLLGRSVHMVTEKAVHPRIRDIVVQESIRL